MSATILAAVLRRRKSAAEQAARDKLERDVADRARALEAAITGEIGLYWRQFIDRMDHVIQSAKGEDGAAGPMPKHQWNRDRTRVRFEQRNDDGAIGWGRWSADLKGEIKAAVITGASGGMSRSAVVTLIQQHTQEPELASDVTLEYVDSESSKLTRKVVDGIETRYQYDSADRPEFTGSAPEGTPLAEPKWAAVKQSFDAAGRAVRRQRLTGVAFDNPGSLPWPA